MEAIQIVLGISLVFNGLLIILNDITAKENEKLKWDNKTKDIQIENRNTLIKSYQDMYGSIKKIIEADTATINELRKEIYNLKNNRW